MAFVVEDGTGLEDANSYADSAGYVAYWLDRGVAVLETQSVVEAALVKATDYLGIRFRWLGYKLTAEQALDWPRACVYGPVTFDEPGGSVVVGVPNEVVKATYEYGRRALAGDLAPDPTVSATGQTVVSDRKKVGPIEVETTFNGSSGATFVKSFPAVEQLLRDLVVATGGRVWRA